MTVPSSNSGVGCFFARAALFLAPLLVVLALDNLILTRGAFTFRAWEALSVATYLKELPGQFYPGQTLHRIEVGDLGHGSEFEVKKEVTWVTDRRGYRNLPEAVDDPEIVIVGDSMTTGSSLDQSATLPRQLEQALGMRTYGFAPAGVQQVVRIMDVEYPKPPKFLIFQRVERLVPELIHARPGFAKIKKTAWESSVGAWTFAYVYLDYLQKLAAIRSIRSWLNSEASTFVTRPFAMAAASNVVSKDGQMITLEGSKANQPKTPEEIERCAQNIASYAAGLRARGIELVMLPVPNKENIYWDTLAPPVQATFLPALAKRVRELGVPCVDLQTPMLEARAAHPDTLLYQLDDTHWTAEGVRIAVAELKNTLAKLPARDDPARPKKTAP